MAGTKITIPVGEICGAASVTYPPGKEPEDRPDLQADNTKE